MKTPENGVFGNLLRETRQQKGWSQRELAQRAGLDASYVNRLESGGRQPARDAALSLAEALGVDGTELDRWLAAAGHAPMPLLTRVRGAVRTRGTLRRPVSRPAASSPKNLNELADFEQMGLTEAGVQRLLQAMQGAVPADRQMVEQAVSGTLSRLADVLESPVRSAVVPAAGGQHRLLSVSIVQRLLLRVIAEAAGEGIDHIVLVLAPGSEEPLYSPLKEAVDMMVVPPVRLEAVIQDKPEGLGDAILRAEELVGLAPFCVLLPDDCVREGGGRDKYPQALHTMLTVFKEDSGVNLLAVTPVVKSLVSRYGIARLAGRQAGARHGGLSDWSRSPAPGTPYAGRNRSFVWPAATCCSPVSLARCVRSN